MNKSISFKILRINYFLCALIITISIFFSSIKINFTMEDTMFVFILLISYLLMEKLPIEFDNFYISFSNYILIISYFIFNIKILLIIIILSRISLLIIDRSFFKPSRSLLYNNNILNGSMTIISVFLSHVILEFFKEYYNPNLNLFLSIVIFHIFFLFFNFLLILIDKIISEDNPKNLSTNKSLLYFLLILILSISTSYLTLFLYNIFQYTIVLLFTLFLTFTSYTLRTITNLRTENKNLIDINECYYNSCLKINHINKLYKAIETIENIVPFSYCGVYYFIDKHEYLYPICYKNKLDLDLEILKLKSIQNNISLNLIYTGKELYTSNKDVINSLNSNLYDHINFALILPLHSADNLIGCIFIGFNKYINMDKHIKLLNYLTRDISLISTDLISSVKRSSNIITSYKDFLEYIDFNINNKVFFTLAIVEIHNYLKIMAEYNVDVYENLRKDVSEKIRSMLSSYDSILYFEKEDIFILFNLQDSLNAKEKLKEICKYFSNYKFNNKIILNIIYAYSEYPSDGINKDEIITKAYKNLYKLKNEL